ncbi:MAG TPA: M14 family metallopeptidase [Longimicrobiales bacterium]|nr:M14 family metallopeptidase [Longimicrobiales bacterium]
MMRLRHLHTRVLLSAALLCSAAPVHAQNDYYFPAGETFDPSVPSPAEFLGYDIGDWHTRHDRIVAYMQELARVSPRATYQSIGTTYEQRAMPVLTVTSPENHARLEQIRQEHLRAIDPAQPYPGAGERPAIVHLGYNVHGNEPSSAEAAMLTAYWLVAGQSPEVQRYLREGVYHVEPSLNPDGRDRHAHWANMHRAEPPVSDPADREHNEVWPGGRTNHYWFDLNRDWLPLENPESRARIEFHHAWRPNVVTDYHEMGTSSSYFFEPSEPHGSWNPLLPEEIYTDITLDFARYWAGALDEIGSFYFTKEVYDNTYPGYGSTYPKFLGGLGLVFEQASSRGHVQQSSHHGELTFAFTIRNHVRTSLATVRAAIDQRARMHDYQRRFFESALDEAAEFPVRAYVFGHPHDASRNREFLDLLLRHRIQVYALGDEIRADGNVFRPGSAWIVPTRQPLYRMVRTIFERTSEYADSLFYDASTWTVSLAYGMPDAAVRGGYDAGAQVTAVPEAAGAGTVPRSSYAYVLDWSDYYAPRALYAMLSQNVRADVAFEPFTVLTNEGERTYPRGSIVVPVERQSADAAALHDIVRTAAADAGVRFQAVASGYVVAGPDLGSRSFRPVTLPRLLMPIGEGLSANEAGQLWHLLDTKMAMPVTKVDPGDWDRIDLNDYDVLVLVSGNHGYIDGERLEALRRWIRAGGTLVATRTATQWAVRNGLAPNTTLADEEAVDSTLTRRDFADAVEIEGAQEIGGSIWLADLDTTHPLAFGYHDRRLAVWRDHELFFEPSENRYSTVAQLTAEPHLSGYISAANLERLRNSPSVLVDRLGRGTVVLLIDNPNFRGYWLGTNRLFLNALLFGSLITVP